MGNFRSDNRRDFRNSGSRPGGRFRGRDNFRDRSSESFERRRPQMTQVTCDKCKKKCEVPFKPTGDKPIFCSDCFKKEGHSDSRNNSQSGISSEQFSILNAKLDKILEILETIELEEDQEDN